MTPSLLIRIASGRTDLVRDVLAAGTPPSITDDDGVRLIQWCAYYGDVTAIRYLLDEGETLASLGDDLGLSAAAFHGHWRLCQFLLEEGAHVGGGPSSSGETPLHAALCSDDRVRYDPVVQVLLNAGADPNATTVFGQATGAFMRDCRTRGETPLHRAAAFGSEATIRYLLDAGASRELGDAAGDTALSWASWYRRPTPILRLLCYDGFWIHPGYGGLAENLVGNPYPE